MTLAPQRVISLLPAATEMIAALGAWQRLVGVSHECDYPAEATALPHVTRSRIPGGTSGEIDRAVRELVSEGRDLFLLDEDAIRALDPQLIVTQGLCEVCAVSETDVRRLAATLPRCEVLSLGATRFDDVLDGIATMAVALDVAPEGRELVDGLLYQLQGVHRVLKQALAPRPRVAVIEWTEPLFAAGHWVPDMVARAGGIDVLAQPGQHSVVTTPAAVAQARPDIVVFAPCGFSLDRAMDEAASAIDRLGWEWVSETDVWALDGNALTSRPGPRLSTGIITLARLMHPGLFGAPPPDRARPVRTRTPIARSSSHPA